MILLIFVKKLMLCFQCYNHHVSFSTSHFPTCYTTNSFNSTTFFSFVNFTTFFFFCQKLILICICTFVMLPHVPLVQFHDYSIFCAPQILQLWFFPIPISALRFLPTTLGPSYDQAHATSSKSSHLSQGCFHGYYKVALSTSPLANHYFLLCHETTTTLLITRWISFSMHLQHSPPIPQAFPSIKSIFLLVKLLYKKNCSHINSMLFSSSLCKLTTKASLDWSSPTPTIVNSTLLLSLNLHCIFSFVHNHHPMINNVAKFLSKFSSTSSSATTTSP